MNKKLLAVAVAGALAAPGVAMAQASSVTIDGYFKVGLEYVNYATVPVNTRLNSSQARVTDGSSQIHFNVIEALGNDLSAVARLDIRFTPENAGAISAGGATWVGLQSKSWGRLTMGRHDLHYGKSPEDTYGKAGALQASAISLFDFINGVAIANATRTTNVVRYDMPTWNGLDLIVAWSANPVNSTAAAGNAVSEGDMTVANPTLSSSRRGDGWNLNPQYTNGPFQIGYSYWRAKPDSPAAVGMDQRGDSLYTYYKMGGFKIGLGWNKSRLDNSATSLLTAQRTAWSLPLSYVTGPHNFVGHYTRANGMSNAAGTVINSGARMVAAAYIYDLSARTSVGLTYAKINNDAAAAYNFFTSAAFGSADAGGTAAQAAAGLAIQPGESPRMLQGTIRHNF